MNEEKICPAQDTDNEIPHCDEQHAHGEHPIADALKRGFPSDSEMYALAEFYKVFGDGTRIRILYALLASELCVCDIADLLGMSISAISHQLRILKQARLVKFRRDGKTVYYSLADEHVSTIICQGLEHIDEHA